MMSYWRIGLGGGALLILCIYAACTPPVFTIAEVHQTPEKFVGEKVEFYVETIVDSVGENGFRIRQNDEIMWVQGKLSQSFVSDFISLDGVFQADSTLQLGSFRIAKNRRLKITVSIIGAAAAVLFLVGALRLGKNALEIDEDA